MTEETTTARCPMRFDMHSSEHAAEWPSAFRQMREHCPRAWSENYGGFWIASRYQDIIKILQNPAAFSAGKSFDPDTGAPIGGVSIPPLPSFRGIPQETEQSEWKGLRDFLNRRFAPKAIEERRERTQLFAAALLDLIIEKGCFDVVDDLTSPLPALVTMDIFGFPLREWRKFADPLHAMAYTNRTDPGYPAIVNAMEFFRTRVDEEIEIRRARPTDDLLSHLATGTIDGEPLDRQRIHDMAFNILGGGVDTTTALASNVLIYLARNPDQRRRLIEEPALLPIAREEFLRYFSPVHALARTAIKDASVGDWQFARGERVLLAYASANRDPGVFEQPEELKMDRFPNRHIAFGAGMHRCLGSFLARMVFDVMVTEVLNRIPDYRVIEDRAMPYHSIGAINGWIRIPATFTPGRKVGAALPV
jgi:cytochrome P450